MKILIYEDNKKDLENLLYCLENFFNEKDIKYETKICNKSSELYAYALDYDLAFLDVEGPDENGIDIGIQIHQINSDIKIIYTTNFSKYALEGYKASAKRYFIKPIRQEMFNLELENVINGYLLNNAGFFDDTICSGKIYIKDIMYVEFIGRKSCLHFSSGKVIETPYPLKYWKDKLEPYFFAQSFKSILVNSRYVKNKKKINVILINGKEIPLSRLYRNEFIKSYLENKKKVI